MTELAHQIGTALEDISRATGSVAHFYKSLDLGAHGSRGTVNQDNNAQVFQPIIDEVGLIRRIPQGQTAQSVFASNPSGQQP